MHILNLTPECLGSLAHATGYGKPIVDDYISPEERPTRNWRQALRHRWHIALKLPYNFVAITEALENSPHTAA
jgi:hypothetical protein